MLFKSFIESQEHETSGFPLVQDCAMNMLIMENDIDMERELVRES
jgi:hypothetical protein